ncbi:AmmeMemoRadiSam system protein B [Bathymodiolus japonicus methanotrophic gill symbiont]|uniref:AmmeMemoRadiSam system protein B n=1 Tax=Bathymodiolus japonicus methanotrophic gill symbiont TaxID=113269 RepID=UPI001C8E52E1|nr:AmmeMemoRadiSam system protein B [Bathymodiolus japonicus methanotrophic gill symbiont]
MKRIRQPAVAGSFYPDNPDILKAMIADYLLKVSPVDKAPPAIIVPHAGYIYSGAIAACALLMPVCNPNVAVSSGYYY